MVNGVFNHFFLNVPQVAAANSSDEELEEDAGDKIEEKPKANNSSYPYYRNYGKMKNNLLDSLNIFFKNQITGQKLEVSTD